MFGVTSPLDNVEYVIAQHVADMTTSPCGADRQPAAAVAVARAGNLVDTTRPPAAIHETLMPGRGSHAEDD